jgi:hypothetical protein
VILLQLKQTCGCKICVEASAHNALRVVHSIVLMLVDLSAASEVSVFSGVMLGISERPP